MKLSFAKVEIARVMRTSDIARLRGNAEPSTHLARYQRAHDMGASHVLAVACPEAWCGACAERQCLKGAA